MNVENTGEPPVRKAAILGRLFTYLLKYKFRMFAGILLSLLVSITNLFTISAFYPIFNLLGQEGPVEIIEVGGTEKARLVQASEGRQFAFYERIALQITQWKMSINGLAKGRSSNEVIMLICLIVLPIYLLKLLCVTGTIYFMGTAGLMAVRDIRLELYKKINYLGFDYYGKERSGLILSRIVNDVELVGKAISTEFTDGVINLFYIITHLMFLAAIDWGMLLIALVVVPVLLAPVSKFAVRVRKAAAGQQERLAEMGAHIQEIISGIRVIRAFSMEPFEKQRFDVINHRLFQNTFRGHYYHQVGPALTEFVGTLVILFFMSWGAYRISTGAMDRGLFISFFIALVFIMRPLKQVSILFNLLAVAAVASARIFTLLDRNLETQETPDAKGVLRPPEVISFRGVGFAYPDTENHALKGVDLVVRKGTTLSIVGSSGAGKSTLMDLLLRFYDVNQGSIEIDGVDIRKIKIKELRRSIGIVSQNVFLFNATVRENIAYGRLDAPLEKIQEAAKMANAHEFIEALPNGYDTQIGERGVMLSGGQRQRIAIARALLLDPPVLVFDEATSSLDNESEMLVQQAIERLLAGRTVFIIAHRLSSVYRSNEIIVLDRGRIVEQGTHQELLSGGTIYKKLYEMQFSESPGS